MAVPEIGNGDYWRRRANELEDDRVETLATKVNRLEGKVDDLDSKMDRVFGALALLLVVVTFLAPFIRDIVLGSGS